MEVDSAALVLFGAVRDVVDWFVLISDYWASGAVGVLFASQNQFEAGWEACREMHSCRPHAVCDIHLWVRSFLLGGRRALMDPVEVHLYKRDSAASLNRHGGTLWRRGCEHQVRHEPRFLAGKKPNQTRQIAGEFQVVHRTKKPRVCRIPST